MQKIEARIDCIYDTHFLNMRISNIRKTYATITDLLKRKTTMCRVTNKTSRSVFRRCDNTLKEKRNIVPNYRHDHSLYGCVYRHSVFHVDRICIALKPLRFTR